MPLVARQTANDLHRDALNAAVIVAHVASRPGAAFARVVTVTAPAPWLIRVVLADPSGIVAIAAR